MTSSSIARFVARREALPVTAPGVLVAVLMVSLLRVTLELLVCAQPRVYPASTLLASVSFYLMAAYAFAAVGARLAGRPLERALSVVLPGLYLGVVPPLLDLAIFGIGRCDYAHSVGLGGRAGVPWQTALSTPGEAITVWLSIALFVIYVAVTTGSFVRTLMAALAGYAMAVIHAIGLSLLAFTFEGWIRSALDQQASAVGSEYQRGFLLALETAVHALAAQVALIASRPRLPGHLRWRLLHGLPFGLLVVLGGVFANLTVPAGWGRVTGLGLTAVAAVVIVDLWVVAIVQNDHFDRGDDRDRGDVRITRDDVMLFTVTGIVVAGGFALASERLGAPLLLFATASVGYSFPSVHFKKHFPANYAVEGVWAVSSFVLGAQSRLPLGRPFPRALLVATGIVFCGWFVFNAFKDYKDIRADVRADVPTLYVLAYHRGIRLRRLHLALRGLLAAGMLVPLAGLSALRLPWLPLAASGAVTIVPAFVVLGRGPHARTVRALLGLISLYIAALALVAAIWGSGR